MSVVCPTCQTPLEVVAALRFDPSQAWETRDQVVTAEGDVS